MPTVEEDICDWMKWVSDDYNVNQLTIPGTHDSWSRLENLTSNWFWEYTVTQTTSLERQLRLGVRYLDLRVGHPGFTMYHGRKELKGRLDDALDEIQTWLKLHGSEAVLVSVNWDQDGANTPDDIGTFVHNSFVSRNWSTGSSWPKLGDVRGKAVLVRRYSKRANDGKFYGIDLSGFFGNSLSVGSWDGIGKWDQQDSGTESGLAKEDRWGRAWQQLDKARNSPSSDGYMYFTGLAGNDASSLGDTPGRYARWINPAFMRHMNGEAGVLNPRKQRFGTILMDFMQRRHGLMLVSKNWEQEILRPGTDIIWNSKDEPWREFTQPNGDNIRITFQRDANLVIYRNNVRIWASDKTAKVWGNEHHLHFHKEDGNLIVWEYVPGKADRTVLWGADQHYQNARLRIMRGPPYLMIDQADGDGNILWAAGFGLMP